MVKAEDLSLEQQFLCAHVNGENYVINELRERLEGRQIWTPMATWEKVLTAADRVAKAATDVGDLWTAEKLSVIPLAENIIAFFRLLQKLIEVTIRANRRAITERRKSVQIMVDVCVCLMKGVLFCYDIEEHRKGSEIPRLVNCVWQCLSFLKNPDWKDRRPLLRPALRPEQPQAAPPSDPAKKSPRKVTFSKFVTSLRETVKKASPSKRSPPVHETDKASSSLLGRSSRFKDDDDFSVAAGFVASVNKIWLLNKSIESQIKKLVKPGIKSSDREDAFVRIFLSMGKMKETLSQVTGGQDYSLELCKAWTNSPELMEQILSNFRDAAKDKDPEPLI